MTVLHILQASPTLCSSLESCQRLLGRHSGIIFIGDAVTTVQRGGQYEAKLKQMMNESSLYVLEPDLQARGLGTDRIIKGITAVDDTGFVRLTERYEVIQSWS